MRPIALFKVRLLMAIDLHRTFSLSHSFRQSKKELPSNEASLTEPNLSSRPLVPLLTQLRHKWQLYSEEGIRTLHTTGDDDETDS